MAFSIPQNIQPTYTIPESDPVNVFLNVGAYIKDLPENAVTAMQKTHNANVKILKEQHKADLAQFDIDFQAAEIKANSAQTIIGKMKHKKAIAITLLVATIIATVTTIVVAALTQTWPILFIAVPCLIALVPTSYYTDIFRVEVNKLENDIAAPKKMKRPVLNLPIYNPKHDLDLLKSRLDMQNSLALMSLREIHGLNMSQDTLLGYDLLNRAAVIQPEKRPAFYGKCIQLINAINQINKEYRQYSDKAEREYTKLNEELRKWKSKEDYDILTQERTLQDHERTLREVREAQRRGELVHVHTTGIVGNVLSRWQLEERKADVAKNYGRRDEQISNWHAKTMQSIQKAYQEACEDIEKQYIAAKAKAI